jgi:hypothetical protein
MRRHCITDLAIAVAETLPLDAKACLLKAAMVARRAAGGAVREPRAAAMPASGASSVHCSMSSSASRSIRGCWLAAAVAPVVMVCLFVAMDTWVDTKPYIFTRDGLADIANSARLGNPGAPPQVILANITATLAARYPGVIEPSHDWVFMRAGGWMGAYKMLYATLTEYVLLFGTAMDTSGHSGRYWAVVEDTLVAGAWRALEWLAAAIRCGGSVYGVVGGKGVVALTGAGTSGPSRPPAANTRTQSHALHQLAIAQASSCSGRREKFSRMSMSLGPPWCTQSGLSRECTGRAV